MIPLRGGADRKAQRVSGVIERSSVDDRPVQKITARVVSIFVVVEDVGNIEFSDREDEPVGGLALGELIKAGVHFLGVAAEINCLPDESPLDARIGVIGANFISFAVGEPGNSVRAVEPESLINFRIDPEFSALPQPRAEVERGVPSLATLTASRQTVGSFVR